MTIKLSKKDIQKKYLWVDTGICGRHYFNGKDEKMIEVLPDQWMCKLCTQAFDLRNNRIQAKPIMEV